MFYHLFSSPSLQNRIPFVLNPKFLIALLISIQSYALLSQSSGVRFNRININQGLSLSSVYCIHQDSKGFLWFGTEDGLNKFDGSNFTIFRYVQGDTNSITYKWIEIIFEDHLGNLWFGSRKGLTRFDPVKEIFGSIMQIRRIRKALSMIPLRPWLRMRAIICRQERVKFFTGSLTNIFRN